MNGSIDSRLADCVATVFPALSPDEMSRASSASMPEWDSMATVTLVALVEEEFGVRMVPDDYVLATSFALLLDYLRSTSND